MTICFTYIQGYTYQFWELSPWALCLGWQSCQNFPTPINFEPALGGSFLQPLCSAGPWNLPWYPGPFNTPAYLYHEGKLERWICRTPNPWCYQMRPRIKLLGNKAKIRMHLMLQSSWLGSTGNLYIFIYQFHAFSNLPVMLKLSPCISCWPGGIFITWRRDETITTTIPERPSKRRRIIHWRLRGYTWFESFYHWAQPPSWVSCFGSSPISIVLN